MNPKPRNAKYLFGLRAEKYAALLLRLKGYRILSQRLRTPLGEIDILARRGKTLAIIEVKASEASDRAHGALLPRQQDRLIRAAQWVMNNRNYDAMTVRFDFIVVARRKNWPPISWPKHYPDAWRPDF